MSHHPQLLRGLTACLSLIFLLFTAAAPAQQPVAKANQYGELADLLEDDASRQLLIDQLRDLQEGAVSAPIGVEDDAPAAEIADKAPSGQTAEQVSLARRMASVTGGLAGDMGRQFVALGALVTGWFGADAEPAGAPAASSSLDMKTASAALLNLVILAVVTFVVFWALRALASSIFAVVRCSWYCVFPCSTLA